MDQELPQPQTPIEPEVNPSSKNPFLQSLKNPYVAISLAFILLVGLLYAAYVFSLMYKLNNKPTITGTKQTPIIKRVESLPENTKPLAGGEMGLNGNLFVFTKATIVSSIKAGESYSLLLEDGQKVTAIFDSHTLIGRAWYDVDSNGVIVRQSYNLISKEDLIKSLKPDQKISLTYKKSSLTPDKKLVAAEFVIQ